MPDGKCDAWMSATDLSTDARSPMMEFDWDELTDCSRDEETAVIRMT